MHKQLLNEATMELNIRPVGPILIKAGDTGADPTRPDMEFVRTWRHGEHIVYLPGSSIKGVLRSHCERIARTIEENIACDPLGDHSCVADHDLKQEHDGYHVHRDSCFTCRMFGNTVLAGRVRTADAYPVDGVKIRTEERNGVAIDRVYGSVKVGPFQMEVLTSGEFETRIAFRNFTIAQLGLLALTLRDLKLGRVGLGFGKSRGLGHVEATFKHLEIRYTRAPTSSAQILGVAKLLSKAEAEKYGYPAIEQDHAQLPQDIRLKDNGWGEWTVTLNQQTRIEEVWRACIPAWKAAVGLA